MATKDEDRSKKDAGEKKLESTFTENSEVRKQNFSNEQEGEKEIGEHDNIDKDKNSGNLADQYHSATKTGDIQKKNSEANKKAAQQGDGYYDQGAHQPNLNDETENND